MKRGFTICFLAAVCCFAALAASDADGGGIRVERLRVAGGAELVTFFCERGSSAQPEIPVVSVLHDTLGDNDPSDDVLRKVWVLTWARPHVLKRAAAALPFLYWRAGASGGGRPSPILDVSTAGRETAWNLAHAVLQTQVLDAAGAPVRSITRAYHGNATDYRNANVWTALAVLDAASELDAASGFSSQEMARLRGRLFFSTRVLGGLVSDDFLPYAMEKDRERLEESRGHNWELLRQKAEDDGLYFQPLHLGPGRASYALLWAARASAAPARFDAQFLHIDSPFEGSWLAGWGGYTQTWYLDANGVHVPAGTPGAHSADMVPVALYSLDRLRAPLLLIDFHRPRVPKRREMARRAATEVAAGVLGISRFGNVAWMAASAAWTFIHNRHGAAVDRSLRLRAYAQLRHAAYMDGDLDPALRSELVRRVEELGVNPFEDSLDREAKIARAQYEALVKWARDPRGLPRKLARARSAELARLHHSAGARTGFTLASIGTLGFYRHHEDVADELPEIARERSFAWHKRFLERVQAASPEMEVAFNLREIEKSLDAVTRLADADPRLRAESEALIRAVLERSNNDVFRQHCMRCLRKLAGLTETEDAGIAAGAGF